MSYKPELQALADVLLRHADFEGHELLASEIAKDIIDDLTGKDFNLVKSWRPASEAPNNLSSCIASVGFLVGEAVRSDGKWFWASSFYLQDRHEISPEYFQPMPEPKGKVN